MTVKAQHKIIVNNNHAYGIEYANKLALLKIAIQMDKEKLPTDFVIHVIRAGLEFEGIADLMRLWANEEDEQEKNEIVSDIQDMLDASSKKGKTDELYVKFNDLDAIAKDIRAFKDSLYQRVMEQGGISKLADLTGIPQPSLSRFFNSNAMPRRDTVLKIAKALNIDQIKIDAFWCR